MSIKNITKADLERLTGLTPQYIDACLKKFSNCPNVALASIVQSRAALPDAAYNNKDALNRNADEVNKLLRAIYGEARKLKENGSAKDDNEVWNIISGKKSDSKPSQGTAAASSSTTASTSTTNTTTTKTAAAATTTTASASAVPVTTPAAAAATTSNSFSSKPFSFGATDSKPQTAASSNNMFSFSTTNTKPVSSDTASTNAFSFSSSKTNESKASADSKSPAAATTTTTTTTTNSSNNDKNNKSTGGFSFEGFKSLSSAPAPAPVSFGKSAFGSGTPATSGGSAFAAPAASPGGKTLFNFSSSPVTTPAASSSGAAAATSSSTAAGAGSSGISFEFAKKPAAAEAPKKKEPVYGEPHYPTCSMMEMPTFWDTEVLKRAALFNLNKGFIEKNKETLRPRLLKWWEGAGTFYQRPVKYVPITNRDDEIARVIIKDAERTFFEKVHREKFAEFLHSIYFEFNSYGQAMSYLAGLCLLGLNEEETAAVLRKVGKEYIPGHWAAEAVGFAANAWVFDFILNEVDKEVHKHLHSLNLWPDTYLQKIFSGLCIHVLPFQILFEFLDKFMQEGFPYLIKFALAIVSHFRNIILEIKRPEQVNEFYELMRLDASAVDQSEVRIILTQADKIDIRQYVHDIPGIRTAMYDKHVAPRIARAPKTEEFEPCRECNVKRPQWYSDTHGIIVCGECKEKLQDHGDWEEY